MSNNYMYRAHIIEEPEFEEYEAFDHRGFDGTERRFRWGRPVGWEASAEYVERFKTNKFLEPDTNKWFKSRSSAMDRVKLLRSMGYTAIVQRSAPVVWPANGKERVENGEGRRIQAAIKTLLDAGIIQSADQLFNR